MLLSAPLEAFVAVVECHTVQAAARRLGLTQTAVTQRIRGLENHLRTTLFLRSRRGMRLTHEGEGLLRYCKTAVALEGETLSWLQGDPQRTFLRFTIAAPSTAMRTQVIPACTTVAASFPRICFTFDIDDSDSVAQKLKNGQADLAVLTPRDVVPEMDSKVLRKERYILVASAQWKKRSVEEIVRDESIVDFNESDPITHEFLKKHGFYAQVTRPRHFVNNPDLLAELVANGVGYSVVTEALATRWLEEGRLVRLLPGRFYDHAIALAWYPRVTMPKYFAALVKAIR